MTTGTEGNDNLTNDRFVQNEVIDALGGNDVIQLTHPAMPAPSITANGGEGYDTLIFGGVIRGSSNISGYGGRVLIRQNSQTHYNVDWTSIERLELSGSLFVSSAPPDFTTGDSDDVLRFSPFAADMAANIFTGLGNDEVYLSGAFGTTSVTTGEGNDVISFLGVTGSANFNGFGGAGDDIYEIGQANGFANENAGEGTDLVRTNRATYTLGANVENLTGLRETQQVLSGNELVNRIAGHLGNDQLYGLGNDDFLTGNQGADQLDGGEGSDTADYSLEAGTLGVVVNLGAEPVGPDGHPTFGRGVLANEAIDSFGNADFLISIENVKGTAAADWLYGSAVANRFEGGGGNDYLDGAAGADTMIGGLGDDIYVVDQAGDVVTELADGGTDTVRTGIGSKTDAALIYTLPENVENLIGTSAGDQGVRDNALDNVFTMGGGNDLIVVDAGGVDTVNGGAGHDFIYFGNTLTAADRIDGGTGNDRVGLLGTYDIVFEAATMVNIERLAMYGSGNAEAPNTYAITLHDGNVAAGATLEVIALSLAANESLNFLGHLETNGSFNVQSGAGADIIAGGLKNDIISGGGGDDILFSLNGDDNVSGGAGDDMIYGGGGNDRLYGGAGKDLLNGGFGNDVFVYAGASESTGTGHDTIHVFDSRVDRIDLPTDAAWNGSVSAGTLSTATFDADLAAAVDGLLGMNGAVLFTPDAGDRAGRIFAVVDGNGDGAYTAGADYVIEFTNPLVPLTGADIFI